MDISLLINVSLGGLLALLPAHISETHSGKNTPRREYFYKPCGSNHNKLSLLLSEFNMKTILRVGIFTIFCLTRCQQGPTWYVTMLMHTWWLQGDKNGPTKVSRSQDSEMNKSYQHQDVACVRVRSETGFTENLKSSRAQGQHSYRA